MEQGTDVASAPGPDWPTWPEWRGPPLGPLPLRAGRDHRRAFPLVVAARDERDGWTNHVTNIQCNGDTLLRRRRDSNYPSHIYC